MPSSPDSSELDPGDVFEGRALDAIRGTPMTFAEAALVVVDLDGEARVQRVYDSPQRAHTARVRYLNKNPLCNAFIVSRATGGGYQASTEKPRRR